MVEGGFFTVSEFAKFSRTTRDILHHYDKIGLLSPVSRGENKYRYYFSGQLVVVNMIRTLQELGMTLSEIKGLLTQRTPERVDELLTQQIEKIDDKITGWVSARKLLFLFQKAIRSAVNVDEDAITIQFLPSDAIILGELNDYSRGKGAFDALSDFYRFLKSRNPDVNLNYPAWGLVTQQQLERLEVGKPERFYLYDPEGHDKRPAGLYAVGYTRGGYGDCRELYQRMLEYIDKHGFEMCGDSYEEYPLNEICISDDSNYLIRVLISVREKKKANHADEP
jgi:DNA-binding transcriptional MerR regulator